MLPLFSFPIPTKINIPVKVKGKVYVKAPKHTNMKLQAHQPAPDFSIRDVHGNNVKLSDYRGQKVYLALNRYTGCPICNVNFHEVQKSAAFLKDKELVILSVHESSQENMENYYQG